MPTLMGRCMFYLGENISNEDKDTHHGLERPKLIKNVRTARRHSEVKSCADLVETDKNFSNFRGLVSLKSISNIFQKSDFDEYLNRQFSESRLHNISRDQSITNMEIPRDQLKLEKLLDYGEFGVVFQAVWKNNNKVAVKQSKSTLERSAYIAEAKRMYTLQHERIVQLLGLCTKPLDQCVLLVVEFMSKGSLLRLLQSEEGKNLTLQMQITMMTQITEGMYYLERKHYVHRDLKASNVLVGADFSVKIADFGLARMVDGIPRYSTYSQFPLRWTAPEAAIEPHVYSTKSDVWSFGVLMYEILSRGQRPYPDQWLPTLIDRIIQGYRLPNPIPHTLDGTLLYAWMNRCWDLDSEKRPSFKGLCTVFKLWNIPRAN